MERSKDRTSSYKGNRAYDRMISTQNISSLRFLSKKYSKRLNKYKDSHDLRSRKEWRIFRDMQRRKKMIDEELAKKIMNKNAIRDVYSNRFQFDSDSGHLIDNETGKVVGSVDFDEEEENVSVRNFEGTIKNKYGTEEETS